MLKRCLSLLFGLMIHGITYASLADQWKGFGINFYIKLGQKMRFSQLPYSLSSLLALTTIGAKNETRSELLDVLQIKNPKELNDLITHLDAINRDWITTKNKSQNTEFANSLWADKNLSFQPDFLSALQKSKSNYFFTVNFKENPEIARQKINQWVERHTQNYIKNLVPYNALSQNTRLVLVNAIYFKGLLEITL